jgi:predicted amidophosphoribosyltransferase
MSAKIACSACRAQFDAGPTVCPSCGLQLTAQALPVIVRKPWWKTWPGILIILILVAFTFWIVNAK